MERMTDESAREIIRRVEADEVPLPEEVDYAYAKGFLLGRAAASREPEILGKERDNKIDTLRRWLKEANETIDAEREAAKEMLQGLELVDDWQVAGVIALPPQRIDLIRNLLAKYRAAREGKQK